MFDYNHIWLIFLDPELQWDVLNNHLRNFNKRIHPVEKNGFCIINSIKEALREVNVEKSIEELIDVLRVEISSNAEYYQSFSADEHNVVTKLEEFLDDPVRGYVQETVDLVLPALTKALKIKATIYKIDEMGQISIYTSGVTENFEMECYFAKTSILHIDPIISIETIKQESTGKMFPCPICSKVLYGPLTLKRHIAKCQPSTSEEEIKPFVPNVRIEGKIKIDLDSSDDSSDEIDFEPSKKTRVVILDSEDDNVDDDNVEDLIYHDVSQDESESSVSTDEAKKLNEEVNTSTSCDDDDDVLDRTLGQKYWTNVERTILQNDNLPADIDGKCVYEVRGNSRKDLVAKIKDGRPWKHDSNTKWVNYNGLVRYKDCNGQPMCQNIDCPFSRQFGFANRLRFDKESVS